MWITAMALAAGAVLQAQGSCACLCMNGEPATLCRTVEQAQVGTNLCSLAQYCPKEMPNEFDSTPIAAPLGGAENCRAVRIWDAKHEHFRTVNVCDVIPNVE